MTKFSAYRKWINEKFSEESDPIQDMGIGMEHAINTWFEKSGRSYPNASSSAHSKLLACISSNKPEFVSYLYRQAKKSITRSNYQDSDYLRYTIVYNNLEILKILVEEGVDLNMSNGKFLVQACTKGNSLMVKFMIDHGADVNLENSRAFYMTAKTDHVHILQLLIDNGIQLTPEVLSNSLATACYNGKIKTAEFIIKLGATVNSNLSRNLLYWKVKNRRIRIIKLLQKYKLIH